MVNRLPVARPASNNFFSTFPWEYSYKLGPAIRGLAPESQDFDSVASIGAHPNINPIFHLAQAVDGSLCGECAQGLVGSVGKGGGLTGCTSSSSTVRTKNVVRVRTNKRAPFLARDTSDRAAEYDSTLRFGVVINPSVFSPTSLPTANEATRFFANPRTDKPILCFPSSISASWDLWITATNLRNGVQT